MKYLLLSLFLVGSIAGFAQTKIGYTNIELVLAYMPEAKKMEASLLTYQKQLSDQLAAKDKYLKTRYQEYLDLKEMNQLTPEDGKKREAELMKLDEELQKKAADSEQQLLLKRQELMEPILEKLQKVIDAVAEEKGLTYMLNQTTSGGVSTILYGPEEYDMTEDLFKKLGIPLPESNN